VKTSVATHPSLPDIAGLRPRRQMAMDCALCARPLGARARVLGGGTPPGPAVPALGLHTRLPDGRIGSPDHLEKGRSLVERRWITGDCWLGCERTGVRVIWLGPVQWDGQHAPFYACGPCLDGLKAQALAYFGERRPASA
jgi:hypothetical protein